MGNTKEAKVTQKILDFMAANPVWSGAGIGAALGAGATGISHLSGTLGARADEMADFLEVKNRSSFKKKYIGAVYGVNTLIGAGTGALAGQNIKQVMEDFKEFEQQFRNSGGYRPRPDAGMSLKEAFNALGMNGSETTKAEAKRKFYRMAQKHHPDLGGSPDAMKKINAAWESVKSSKWFNKLAFINLKVMLEKHAATIKKKAPSNEVVMYHASWAGPSKEHHAVLHRIAKKYGVTPRVVDTDSEAGLAEATKAGVKGVPHVMFMKDGDKVGEYAGHRQESHVHAFFKSHVGGRA